MVFFVLSHFKKITRCGIRNMGETPKIRFEWIYLLKMWLLIFLNIIQRYNINCYIRFFFCFIVFRIVKRMRVAHEAKLRFRPSVFPLRNELSAASLRFSPPFPSVINFNWYLYWLAKNEISALEVLSTWIELPLSKFSDLYVR